MYYFFQSRLILSSGIYKEVLLLKKIIPLIIGILLLSITVSSAVYAFTPCSTFVEFQYDGSTTRAHSVIVPDPYDSYPHEHEGKAILKSVIYPYTEWTYGWTGYQEGRVNAYSPYKSNWNYGPFEAYGQWHCPVGS